MKQGLDTIPQNLDADAHEEKGREPQDDAHAAFADDCGETIGKTVTKKNAQRHERRTNDRRKNGKEIRAQVVRLICAESDGDRNRTRTDGERQGQRVKSVVENILQVDLFLDVDVAVVVFLTLEHGPPVGNDDEAAADLDDRNGNSKEIQDVRADQERSNQQHETVHGHAAGQGSARGGGIFLRQGEKDRAAAERIHDRKQRTENQQDTFCGFQQGSSGEESIAEARRRGNLESSRERVLRKLKRNAAAWAAAFRENLPPGLEEEADSNLNLAAGVSKIAIGVGDAAEGRVEGQGVGSCGATDDIPRIVDAGNVLVIEEIEGLTQDLRTVVLTEANLLGQADVHVNGALHLEGVATDDIDTLPAIGTVDARSKGLVRDCGDVARGRVGACREYRRCCTGGNQRVGQTALRGVDRRELPVIGQVAQGSVGVPRALDDGTGNDAVGHVEDRVAVFGLDIARYKEVVGVREDGSILAEIQRMRPSITPHELNMLGHSAVELNRKRVVVGGDAAENLGHRAKIRVGPRTVNCCISAGIER